VHPAYSVVFFTTMTGAGYGLLALLGVGLPLGLVPTDFWFALAASVLALGLITAGLLTSTAHLGRPERAWRAFSQWRSSWLSREGVAAVATYPPATLFAIGWIFLSKPDGWVAAAGVLAAIGAVCTVCATGMIYASLKPIPQWHSPFTLPGYLIYSAMTGLVLLHGLLQAFGNGSRALAAMAFLATGTGLAWKVATWRHNDRLIMPSANSATGLASGCVQSMEWPHTQENYLLKEMGYRVARKHRVQLRRMTIAAAFAFPALLLLGATVLLGPLAAILAGVAVISQLVGVLIERWLFFAEARHTVTVYYGG
jgi:DMSO reductase anchor subunit